MLMTRRLSIVIPVYNEEKTIKKILNRILDVKLLYGYEKEIIMVNDCSSDNSVAVIEEFINNHPEETMEIFHQRFFKR